MLVKELVDKLREKEETYWEDDSKLGAIKYIATGITDGLLDASFILGLLVIVLSTLQTIVVKFRKD